MSIVDLLNKKHKVMNCVFEILYDLYGEPMWLKKPKDGQVPEKIIEQWIAELGDYSETQLKQACYNLFKYKKVSTFPKLAHIIAELSDQPKNDPSNTENKTTSRGGICIEHELMKRDIEAKRCKHFFPDYRDAVYYIMNDLLKQTIGAKEFAELEAGYRNNSYQCRGSKYQRALELGLFDNFHQILDEIARKNHHG